MKPEKLAKWMHDEYEKISKKEKWNTQKNCKVEFEDLPEENKAVMIELAKRIIIKFLNNTNA
ncbi:MAG TPA: hypothetical protein ENH99_01675 [Candidatus Pacearchaeota archaeon]|nr:hypothetical protein [Candidatus Pacearchaeota archaeon]